MTRTQSAERIAAVETGEEPVDAVAEPPAPAARRRRPRARSTAGSGPAAPADAQDTAATSTEQGTVGAAVVGSAPPETEAVRIEPGAPGPAPEAGLDRAGAGQLDAAPEVGGPPSGVELPVAPLGSLVTVFSPKGGTGTTFVATNLARSLAEPARVCLVDLDLQFGDVGIMTSQAPSRSIVDAVAAPAIDGSVVDAVVSAGVDGLDCVLAPVDPAAADGVTAALVSALLTALRGRYQYVVVDTPSQLTEPVLEALEAADHHVLVTTSDLPALKNLRIALDTLTLLGAAATRSVVLNRVEPRSGLTPAEVEAAVGQPLAAVLPAHPDAAESIGAGIPLVTRRPDSVLAGTIREFARTAIAGEPVSAKRRGLRLGRISRTRA